MKKVVFDQSILVSGMMCDENCSPTIFKAITNIKLIPGVPLSSKRRIMVGAEPQTLALQRLSVVIEDEGDVLSAEQQAIVLKAIETKITQASKRFNIVKKDGTLKSTRIYRFNLLVNLLALVCLTVLWVTLPPSLLLTISLMSVTFFATAWTSRHYFLDFVANLRYKKINHMATPITLGWFLSLAHALYHTITMPLMHHFSMFFMNFIMPISLVSLVNIMDEIRRFLTEQTAKMHLQERLQALMPPMSSRYDCYRLSRNGMKKIDKFLKKENRLRIKKIAMPYLEQQNLESREKIRLQRAMLIRIKRGQCFPVDGFIIDGSTYVDTAIVTGEPCHLKTCFEFVPAGAVNLGQTVTIVALQDSYHSTMNKIFFRANRAVEKDQNNHRMFTLGYTAVIVVCMLVSVFIPFALGTLSVSLLLSNIIGILFTICPCTIVIAHQLPGLLARHRCYQYGVIIRNEQASSHTEKIHTIVFDKTGTLTTGHCIVKQFSPGITKDIWTKVYSLEMKQGSEHPLAQALQRYYENTYKDDTSLLVDNAASDDKHRGLTGTVGGEIIHIGNKAFLEDSGIGVPEDKSESAYTAIYVARNNKYCGTIWIQHEVRPGVLSLLKQFKKNNIKLVLLTGDNARAAQSFNEQNGSIFEPDNVLAEKTPQQKESYLKGLPCPQGVCFVGDGLNDAVSARLVTEQGGLSCAMTSRDKVAFFSDVGLNGSPAYLLHHTAINRYSKKVVKQNQGLLGYGAISFLTFLIVFSTFSISFPALIPLVIMSSVTLLTVVNAYRSKWNVDHIIKPHQSALANYLLSDGAMVLLLLTSTFFMTSVLMASVAASAFVLPAMVFSGGLLPVLTTVALLATVAMTSILIFSSARCALKDYTLNHAAMAQESALSSTLGQKFNYINSPVLSRLPPTPEILQESLAGLKMKSSGLT